MVEQECERALGAEGAAMLCEVGAHVRHGAGVVVGGGFNEDSDSVGAVST